MKFLEFTTAHGSIVLLNTEKIVSVYKTKLQSGRNQFGIVAADLNAYQILEDEYNRITQTIDKVDHL